MDDPQKAIVRPTSSLENLIQAVFPIMEKIMPSVARNFAVTLFIRPFRFPYKPEEEQFMETCERFKFTIGGVEHHGFKKGSGPAVLCVHGWSGRSTQFRFMAPKLIEAGYTFVTFDALAHGRTEGKKATLFDFAQAIKHLLSAHNDVRAVIGHSLGAASVSYAISEGAHVPAFIAMGAPVVGEDILNEFCNRLNGSPKIKDAIRARSREEFGIMFDEVLMEKTFSKVTCPVLGIHGKLDVDAPPHGLDVLKQIRPDMDTLLLPNMGHRRILKEDPALALVVNWLRDLK